MLSKLDSSEFARSWEQNPTLPETNLFINNWKIRNHNHILQAMFIPCHPTIHSIQRQIQNKSITKRPINPIYSSFPGKSVTNIHYFKTTFMCPRKLAGLSSDRALLGHPITTHHSYVCLRFRGVAVYSPTIKMLHYLQNHFHPLLKTPGEIEGKPQKGKKCPLFSPKNPSGNVDLLIRKTNFPLV